jgi:hypothetical protein
MFMIVVRRSYGNGADRDAFKIVGIVQSAWQDTPRLGMPGWEKKSWAFRSDDGHLYDGGQGREYADKPYGKLDTIGCLYDLEKSEVSFTYNGTTLGELHKLHHTIHCLINP